MPNAKEFQEVARQALLPSSLSPVVESAQKPIAMLPETFFGNHPGVLHSIKSEFVGGAKTRYSLAHAESSTLFASEVERQAFTSRLIPVEENAPVADEFQVSYDGNELAVTRKNIEAADETGGPLSVTVYEHRLASVFSAEQLRMLLIEAFEKKGDAKTFIAVNGSLSADGRPRFVGAKVSYDAAADRFSVSFAMPNLKRETKDYVGEILTRALREFAVWRLSVVRSAAFLADSHSSDSADDDFITVSEE